jgi:transcriptional regulator with XRE-family HTH domain
MATSPKTGDLQLGKKIAARRDELGLSRRQLAEATSLSYPYIAQIETGYRLPSTRHQVILAKVLGMSLDELFGTGEEPPQRRSGLKAASSRRRRATIDDATEHAAQEIEALPASVRLQALSRIQLRILQSVADDQAKQRG